MGVTAQILSYTVEEYLDIERNSEIKHEFHDGELFAMAGGTFAHNRLSANTSGALWNVLKGKKCRPSSSDQQIAVSRYKYVYPDLSVICGEFEWYEEHPHAAKNPVLIVEVLSNETESYDRGGKFMWYRQLPTFKEYILISQKEVLVEVFCRKQNDLWAISTYENLSDTIHLQSIDVTISLEDIYEGVEIAPVQD